MCYLQYRASLQAVSEPNAQASEEGKGDCVSIGDSEGNVMPLLANMTLICEATAW